jgi:hypothetical protein
VNFEADHDLELRVNRRFCGCCHIPSLTSTSGHSIDQSDRVSL